MTVRKNFYLDPTVKEIDAETVQDRNAQTVTFAEDRPVAMVLEEMLIELREIKELLAFHT